jgi:phosphoribosylaminoimidazolecarboxamide formyltransferase/IMP cyclohydrolase
MAWAPRHRELAYGENPHQAAAFFRVGGLPPSGLAAMEVLGGKPLSYNNLLDTEAVWRLLAEFTRPAAAIVKHNTPCGVAVGETSAAALRAAIATDREAAFGGVFGINTPLTPDIAHEIGDLFVEVLAFPSATPEGLESLAGKKRLRLLRLPPYDAHPGGALDVRAVAGGFLVQEADPPGFSRDESKVVTRREPGIGEWRSLEFAWRVAKHVKSNAIVLARDETTIGVGAGQMSRVDSVRLAVRKAAQAGLEVKGTVLASDGFFPFADNVEEAAKAGVTAIIQPGGSIRDAEVVEAADRLGIAMVFTGRRHFRH